MPDPVPVSPSAAFCADDADVVIRAAGTRDFQVHKLILSVASPIFKDMFTIPQPLTDTPDTLPHVDVNEPAETWEKILRTTYPMSNPTIDDLGDLESLLLTAKKYEMQFVIDSYVKGLEDRGFIQQDPLRLYAIACACGLEDQAKHVARSAELLMVTGHTDAGDLRGLTVGSYHNLVSFLVQRDNQWHQLLSQTRIPADSSCECDTSWKAGLYNGIKADLKGPYLQKEEIYLKALQDRLRQLRCKTRSCSTGDSEIRAFIEQMVKKREELCDKLMYEKQYVP